MEMLGRSLGLSLGEPLFLHFSAPSSFPEGFV